MKTQLFKKSLVLLTIALFISFNVSADGNKADSNKIENPKVSMINDVSNAIKDHVKFPNVLLNYGEQESVNVVFTVNETGQVNLVIANTLNQTLKKAVESEFLKLTLNKLKPNNVYSIMFNFKKV